MTDFERAMEWVASQQTRWVGRLIELSNKCSGSYHLDGLRDVSEYLARWQIDVPCERIDLPHRLELIESAAACKSEGKPTQLSDFATGPGLLWQRNPQANRRALLGIHYDTVYAPEHRPNSCHWVSDNKLVGPGVADARGGIVVAMAALEAVERFGLCDSLDQPWGWTLFFNPDEEIGSPSSHSTWTQLAKTHHVGLLFEPALPDGALVSERKGSGNFSIVVRGRSAHAGRDFFEGRNAIALASQLVQELDGLNRQFDGVTVNVGRIVGGGAVNVVPDWALIRFNVRVPNEAGQRWFEQQYANIQSKHSNRDGMLIECFGSFTSPAKNLNDRQSQLMQQVQRAGDRLGQTVHWRSSGGVCDGNRLFADGLPNIDTLGPIGDRLHSPDEWVDPTSIVPKAQMVLAILREIFGE